MKVFVIAGEPSGDALGAALLDGLGHLRPDLEAAGVAGPLMQAAGATTLFSMEELSVMGLMEVLPRYPALRRRVIQTAEAALAIGADAVVTIDSPDFCLRVAARIKAEKPDMPVIHYVAPSVWAWRPKRAARMARHVDHVLALLPFEPPFMHDAGMTCDFVGHPAAAEPRATDAEIALFRKVNGIGGEALLILPGSRAGEIARLSEGFGIAAALLMRSRPGMVPVVPVAPGRMRQVREVTARWSFRPVLADMTDPETRRAAFGAGSAAFAASGTVSLDLARAGVPMVIGYDFNRVTRAILRRLVRVDTATLVNLVSETRAVPEFLGVDFDPPRMAAAMARVLADPEPQIEAMRITMERLGQGGEAPGLRAARSVLAAIERLSA